MSRNTMADTYFVQVKEENTHQGHPKKKKKINSDVRTCLVQTITTVCVGGVPYLSPMQWQKTKKCFFKNWQFTEKIQYNGLEKSENYESLDKNWGRI